MKGSSNFNDEISDELSSAISIRRVGTSLNVGTVITCELSEIFLRHDLALILSL